MKKKFAIVLLCFVLLTTFVGTLVACNGEGGSNSHNTNKQVPVYTGMTVHNTASSRVLSRHKTSPVREADNEGPQSDSAICATTVYCLAESKPDGWDENWCPAGTVIWGYTPD